MAMMKYKTDRRRNKMRMLMMLALFGWIGISNAADRRFADYNCRTGIVYKTVNGEALDMALFLPTIQKQERMPVMLYTHGGGWSAYDKTVIFWPPFRETMDILLSNGIACVSIEYRLTRKGVSTAYDAVVDCKDAARYLVKHADEYNLAPDRMGAWGGSAGGHLSLMTALAPNDQFPGDPALAGADPQFRCVVSYFPATTFLVPEIYNQSNFRLPGRWVPFLGGFREEHLDLAALLSPAEHLHADSPPVLLLHGDRDQVLSYDNSTYMLDLAAKTGADVQLVTVTNALHSFAGDNISPSIPEISRIAANYILKHLAADQ